MFSNKKILERLDAQEDMIVNLRAEIEILKLKLADKYPQKKWGTSSRKQERSRSEIEK